MVDLDIPTNTPPQTNTLLHWLQTGLTSADTATTLNTTMGSQQVFLLQNRQSTQPLAMYLGPNPPARIPLSHRYTFVLVDHTQITTQGLSALTSAAATRLGFNAQSVLTQAGLAQRAVAGNFFNVTNAGPAQTNGTTGGGSGTGSPTGTAGSPGASTTFRAAGMMASPQAGLVMLCLGLVGAVFLGL
jgi:phosphatidylethanolamine-binding protein